MTLEAFQHSLQYSHPPEGLPSLLLALWYESKGDWESCHTIVQDIPSKEAALIHAYLHRKEGDRLNAEYWYQRGGGKLPQISLEDELNQLIIKHLE
jgi:hypothetical protein